MIFGKPGIGKTTIFKVLLEIAKEHNNTLQLWLSITNTSDFMTQYKLEDENGRKFLQSSLMTKNKVIDDIFSEGKYMGTYFF